MPYRILRRIVYALAFATAVTLVMAKVVEYGGAGAFGRQIGLVAWWVSAWPLIACGMFVLMQGLPGGRKIVTSFWSRGGDAWPMLLVLLMATPSAEAGRLVAAESGVGSGEVMLLTLAAVLLCFVARIIQLHIGARLGVTLDDGAGPMLH